MLPSAPRRALASLLTCSLLSPPVAGAAVAGTSDPLRWERVARTAPEDAPTAVVADPAGGVVVGGARGVRRILPRGLPETLLRRGPVADLVFLQDDSLLVATGQGLYRMGDGREPERERLAVDGRELVVARLDAARGVAAAATDRGVYLRGAAGGWRRVHALPQGAASLVALRPRGGDLELWSVIDGELWIAAHRTGAGRPWRFARRTTLPVALGSEPARDVAFDVPGVDAVLVFPDRLAVRDRRGAWRALRPTLPPGAAATRIAVAFGRVWLATDAGLLSAHSLEGPWRRATPPVGSLPVIGLVGGATLAALTHRGVMVASSPRAPAPAEVVPRPDPLRIAGLQRSALRHQGLDPARLADARRRVRRRGWLPELDVDAGYDEERDRAHDYDQSFVSGDTRYLYDKQNDYGSGFDVSVSLSWDLGDLVFDPEEIDLSREARSVIALRDDVLDEVTQLYFERERVLAQLAAKPQDDPGRHALALRAAELAAGLDAWTGGAFSASAPDARGGSTRSRIPTEERP